MHVKAPQPLKRRPVATHAQSQSSSKPVLARRLIGNASGKPNLPARQNGSSSSKTVSTTLPKSPSTASAHLHRSSSTSNFKSACLTNKSDPPSFRNKLFEITVDRKLASPKYQSYTTSSRHKNVPIYLSKVAVADEYWSSHPDSVSSPDEGEELAAKKAFLELSSRPPQQTSPFLEQGSDEECRQLVDQLVQILIKEQFPLLSSAVPEKFSKQFSKRIAENWLKVIEQFPQDIQIEK